MVKTAKDPADYILPLYMNGLSGRMLKMPSKVPGKKREILFISGQHTSLERILGIGEYLSKFGNITSPDMPGFGGMDPFYKIGEKPTLDNMADYLASFIKLRYHKRRLTIIGVSYGFGVITRMLQRYPDIAKRVDLLVSLSGIVDKNDFRWKSHNIRIMRAAAFIFSHRTPAFLASKIGVRGPIIRGLYKLVEKRHPKFKDAKSEESQKRIDFEITLWKINDFRTWMETCTSMFKLSLGANHVDLMVYHVSIDNDHYFDSLVVEQHMRTIYQDFKRIRGRTKGHAPTVIATSDDAALFVPPALQRILNKKPAGA